MDWTDFKIDSLTFDVRGLEMQAAGKNMLIPVVVYNDKNQPVHRHNVQIRRSVLNQLKDKSPDDWKKRVHEYCAKRLREEHARQLADRDGIDLSDMLDLEDSKQEKL